MIALMVLVGFVAMHWQLVGAGVIAAILWRYGRQWYAEQLAAQSAAARRRAEIVARADRQHAEVIAGDGHGTYGDAWSAQRKFDSLAA